MIEARRDYKEAPMMNRQSKERKLVALMVNDLEANLSEPEMARVEEEVHNLPGEELDRTLAQRLDLSYPVREEELERALAQVEEPEHPSAGETGGFTGAPDMSHEGRPEERES